MASEIRKVGEHCPYRVGGRRHATLHPNVTFRHEDHSTCRADSRPGPRPHHRPSRSSPAIHGPDSRRERAVSVRPLWSSLRNVWLASARRPSPRRLPRSLVRQEEHRSVGLAIDQCQQTCPLTVALEHFQGGKDLQQVLLAANRKNDCRCWQQKMILITFAVCASVAAPTSSSGGHTFDLADASATGSD